MIDNEFATDSTIEEIIITEQEEQIVVNAPATPVTMSKEASFASAVKESPTIDITVGEVSSVPLETRIVVNHTASDPNQHTISAITGLRAELDDIKSLKTVYSDKTLHANYYEWENGNAYDAYGYFVSLVPGTSTIKICDGSDILGVSVDSAGFIGGQDATVPRDNTYGLIATSGLVDVHCELEIKVGDYVVSNAQGYARKSGSNYGYRVLATEDKDGERYAVIALGVQADKINELGLSLGEVKEQVDVNYKNITSAVNVANQAYNKATETETSNKVMSDKVDGALAEVGEMSTAVENMGAQVSQAQVTSAQAKAIAESAATSAASMKNEAVESANSAAAQVGELTKTLEPLTTWTDPETGNKGASYLANYIDNGLATKVEIEAAEKDLEHVKSAVSKNAESLQSLVVSIDKYSVGEYSTAHGLTLEQATNILEPDIIYVPTVQHKEEYSYVNGEETVKYEREFVPGYLYRWGELPNGLYGWITVDKYYSEDKLNTSAPSVYFSAEVPSVIGDFGYWYTNSDTVSEGYEPYTLYKWIEGSWVAVATLAGNTQSRAISQVRQTANSIEASVTNMKGDVAASKQWIEDNSTNIQDVVTWKGDNAEAIATTIQSASDSEAYIAQIASVKNEDGTINAAASIVTAVNNGESSVSIDADHINFEAENYSVKANKIDFTGDDYSIDADRITMTGTTTFIQSDDLGDNGSTVISGSRITTGTLDAEKVKVINLQAANIVVTGSNGNNQTVDEALANTLVSSTTYYALSTSTKTPPADNDWSEEAPEKERKKYMWQKTVNVYGDGSIEEKVVCIAGATGDGPIVVEITCSTGTIYINNNLSNVTLTAKASQDNKDITNEFKDEDFLWEKYDMNGRLDTTWSYTGKTISISHSDIYKRAVFNCILKIEETD